MHNMLRSAFATLALAILLWQLSTPAAPAAGFLDRLLGGKSKATNAPGAALAGALTPDQMTQGLKEALGNGVQHAIRQLGSDGGFLTNLNVKIPMPEKLQTVEKTLRKLKQERLADEFVTTMNRAAEKAVPAAAEVFGGAIKQMSIEDARAILTGPPDAATQYFRRTSQTNLFAKFHPVVKQATDQAGVTASYKQMMDKVNAAGSFGGFGVGSFLNKDATDVDSYVTNKALDGLFKMVAEQEKQIRENPVARTTDLLKKVFGTSLRP